MALQDAGLKAKEVEGIFFVILFRHCSEPSYQQ